MFTHAYEVELVCSRFCLSISRPKTVRQADWFVTAFKCNSWLIVFNTLQTIHYKGWKRLVGGSVYRAKLLVNFFSIKKKLGRQPHVQRFLYCNHLVFWFCLCFKLLEWNLISALLITTFAVIALFFKVSVLITMLIQVPVYNY